METIELWYAVDQDGEGYFYTDEPYRADYNIWGSQGEVYSVKDKLFSNVEVPQITWDNEPVKLEMTYEVTQKS
jgi:hypothetical protein